MCLFAKNSHNKLPVFTARLIQALKRSQNREQRKSILDLFNQAAELTSSLNNAEKAQLTVSKLLLRTIDKVISESGDIKVSGALFKILSPFSDDILTSFDQSYLNAREHSSIIQEYDSV